MSETTTPDATAAAGVGAAISVTTRSFDNQRTGWNYNESVQTPAKIRAKGMRLARQFKMWGDARGTEGMPLVAAGITMRDTLKHDLLIANTMGGDVFCWDHNTLRVMWVQHLLNALPSSTKLDEWNIADNWSFLSAPYLDVARGMSWHCGLGAPDGTTTTAAYWVFGLNMIDGSLVCPPINLNLASYQPPDGLPVQKMAAVMRKQRCALLGDMNRNGVSTIFIAQGSQVESADTNRGWLTAIDVTVPAEAFMACSITSTSRYSGGGYWQGGQGPSIDSEGFIHLVVGNGAFDAKTDFGECGQRIKYTPKSANTAASFAVDSWDCRFTDTGRVAQEYQTLADLSLIPGGGGDDDDGPPEMDGATDCDENSGGAVILLATATGFSTDLVFRCGKDGWSMLNDALNLPSPTLADFDPSVIQTALYPKIKNLTGFTYYPAGFDITPTDLSTIPTQAFNYTRHHHSTPLHYQSPKYGCLIYGGGENGYVRCFQITEPKPGAFAVTYMATGTVQASPEVPPPGGMPGHILSGWSNGSEAGTGAIAAFCPYGNANTDVCFGRLVIYAADSFEPGGELEILWDGEKYNNGFPNGDALIFNKFNVGPCIGGVLDYFSYDARALQWV